ncbi:PREDICTED: uncharacterized protein LOC105573375 isoform X2 [Cercocebus atys]|uniref:uncharacterized protein LOC105573375 isoform X2 n=1 Tax=Cercocebus atys TaxID=9531 RepID=UPI0005F49E6B|nr:PREDICTED: uncharacterized protein LOC105573375 isoform X2 [Cercocebus atys]
MPGLLTQTHSNGIGTCSPLKVKADVCPSRKPLSTKASLTIIPGLRRLSAFQECQLLSHQCVFFLEHIKDCVASDFCTGHY